MNNRLLIGATEPTSLLGTSFIVSTLTLRWRGVYILVLIGFDELCSYLEGDFLHDKTCREPVN